MKNDEAVVAQEDAIVSIVDGDEESKVVDMDALENSTMCGCDAGDDVPW